ncbi:YncE family protein [Alteraurantiacibacter aquimixticola]|uniref:YncE family protein n=1 Tax=Alteraurantiacibacter aquimixticola TaxID=2489173 RepID=A0A4T3F602_9SPHN|nr:YncE family protein [Alteraurantiacibacter aquimixticola]TIX50286.1 YncE family protein [Alteraurantiacibacter aquimixticola]
MKYLRATVLALACTGCSGAGDGSGAAEAREITGTLIVANKRGASLSRVDLASGRETDRVRTCENPHELTVSPDNEHVLVACYSGTQVQAFAIDEFEPAFEIDLGAEARVHSAQWFADDRILAGAEGRGSAFLIELKEGEEPGLTETGMGGEGPHMVAVNDAGTMAWGTIISAGTVVRYDLVQGIEAMRRAVGDQIEGLALSPDGDTVWVSSNTADRVYRLDALSLELVATIHVGDVPIRIAAHPGGEFVVTSNFGTGDLSVIEVATNTVTRTIPVSGSSEAAQVTLVFSPDGERLYVAETANDEIAEIDFASGEVLRRLPSGPGGDGLAVID